MLRADLYQLDSIREPQCRRVLSLAAETGWVTVRDIALRTGWSKATVESTLDQLTADRLVEVDGPPSRQVIHLTSRGAHAIQTLYDTRGIEIDG
jgi:DNA-binding MarR family transcriptional regulator